MFAKKLKRLNHNVTLDVLEGLPHGFLNFSLVIFLRKKILITINFLKISIVIKRSDGRIETMCKTNRRIDGFEWPTT